MDERGLLETGLGLVASGYPSQAVDKLLKFSELLLEKNKVMNLTAVSTPEEVATRHFLDCASLFKYIAEAERVIDIGTGAGFPGIPLAVLCPSVRFVLLDAQKKRVEFLREAVGRIGISNCEAVQARAEDYAKAHREGFSIAVSRAVAELRVLCELSMPLVETGGAFLAMKAAGCEEEADRASNAAVALGGGRVEILRYVVPLAGTERSIVRITKERETPERYPRRFKKIMSEPL